MKLPGNPRAVAFLAVTSCLALVGLFGATASAREDATSPKREVSIVEFTFNPGRTIVARGGRVTFVNNSKYTHTATNKGDFDTGHIPPGESATLRFQKPGVYGFHCLLHPFMTGKIVVKK